MVFNLDESNENYEERLPKESEGIINTLNLWKIAQWVAVLYNSSRHLGALTVVLLIHYFYCATKVSVLTLKQFMLF